MRLLPPLLTLVASSALAWLGYVVWDYRHAPAPWITDPTSFKLAAFVAGAIFFPSVTGALLSIAVLVQRLLPRKARI